jgi:hypothetical protein
MSGQRYKAPLRRMLAWLLTGPVGHFAAGLLDWVAAVRALRRR